MRAAVISLMLAALPTCAGAREPEIVQLSPDTYMIVKEDRAGIFGGGLPKLKVKIIKQANAFAEKQGKVAIPIATSETPMAAGGQFAMFEYQFRVVDKDDPEAARTSLVSRPDTVITVNGSPPPPMPTSAPAEGSSSDALYSALLKLDDLRKRGLLTDDEFEQQKRKLLSEH